MDPLKPQLQDVLSRITNLEQRERKNSEEILSLTKENSDLMRKAEKSERKCEELSGKLLAMEKRLREFEGLKTGMAALLEGVENKKDFQENMLELGRIKRVLNRSLVQSHKTAILRENETNGEQNGHGSDTHKENLSNGQQMQPGDSPVQRNLSDHLDKVDFLIREVSFLKEFSEKVDEQRNAEGDESLTLIKALKERNDKSDNSVFCAQLQASQPLTNGARINRIVKMMPHENSPLQSGTLHPPEDGVYNLSWRMLQRGIGKIFYQMCVDGLEGRIVLGRTVETGDVCSGTFVIPLKRGQGVWLFAKREGVEPARVVSCNFMGWLLKSLTINDSSEDFIVMQKELCQSNKLDCQLL